MKSTLKPSPLILLGLLGLLSLLSCGTTKTESPGEIRLRALDVPAAYDAVNLVVGEVSVHLAGSDDDSGWIVVNDSTTTFDLLTLTNGASRILAAGSLDAGHYTQIRLKLETGSTVVVDGETHPLVVPSGLQTGLKLIHQFEILPSTLYALTLDFDAERSITLTGSGIYQLSPVIRVVPDQISGTIFGIVSPASAKPVVSTLAGLDVVSVAADTTSGMFRLMALPQGMYEVHVVPGVGGYRDTTIADVVVVAKQDTDLGLITLSPQ